MRNSYRLANQNTDNRFRRHLGPHFTGPYKNRILPGKGNTLGMNYSANIRIITRHKFNGY